VTDLFAEMAADAVAGAAKAAPTTEQSEGVRAKAVELVALDQRIEKGEALLKELRIRREIVATRELVDAMDAIGQDLIGLAEFEVDIKTEDYVFASIPNPDGEKDPDEAARKAALRKGAFAWLVENEHEGLIKTVVTVELPRGAFADANRIKRMIDEMPAVDPETGEPVGNGAPIGYCARVQESVHWGTLTSFVKEQLKRPEVTLPLEMLGATVGRVAKIVKRKKGKK
jgi:hypothetical protein